MKVSRKHLHLAQRKMGKIIDEIYAALLHYGGQEVDLRIVREESGLRLFAEGDFDPDHLRHIERMGELLHPAVRSEAMVEAYWELAGEDQYTSDSELALVGQMAASAELSTEGNRVSINLFVAF